MCCDQLQSEVAKAQALDERRKGKGVGDERGCWSD